MATKTTPGVYVEEVSLFPPSVAEVATAVPAFIGYTEKAERNGVDLTNTPVRIKSVNEYPALFGGGSGPVADSLVVTLDDSFVPVSVVAEPQHLLYYSLRLFEKNGGGPCYIVSVGSHEDDPTLGAAAFDKGLQEVKKFDEPTILLFPGATRLTDDELKDLQQATLTQCAELMDRIGVFDLKQPPGGVDTGADAFRARIGVNNLKYGAAYTPYLKTSIPMSYRFEDIRLQDTAGDALVLSEISEAEHIEDNIEAGGERKAVKVERLIAEGADQGEIDDAVEELTTANWIYAGVAKAISSEGVVLPPSAAAAGVMAFVDRTRGVWKAPANVSLNQVTAPTIVIDDADQSSLNVDVNAGMSINAIRSFTGKGNLVWGARTLAGNDNEWRYLSVRRFFNMVEESVKKSTSWAVFEPNAAPLWAKVKSMIENYLRQKWREGALAGAAPADAFYVKVGLGETMTSQDILEGRLIVEIGMAVVRPAEFIILKFSHKMQES